VSIIHGYDEIFEWHELLPWYTTPVEQRIRQGTLRNPLSATEQNQNNCIQMQAIQHARGLNEHKIAFTATERQAIVQSIQHASRLEELHGRQP
jgi:hypothetical protein